MYTWRKKIDDLYQYTAISHTRYELVTLLLWNANSKSYVIYIWRDAVDDPSDLWRLFQLLESSEGSI